MNPEQLTYQLDQPTNQLLFNSSYEKRLSTWRNLRNTATKDDNFIATVLDVYQHCPLTNTDTDYFKNDTWPSAWQLLETNEYNLFDKCLAIMYTVNLTERFCDEKFSIIRAVTKLESYNNHKFYYIIKVGSLYIDCQNKESFDEQTFDKKYIQQYNKIIRKTDK